MRWERCVGAPHVLPRGLPNAPLVWACLDALAGRRNEEALWWDHVGAGTHARQLGSEPNAFGFVCCQSSMAVDDS